MVEIIPSILAKTPEEFNKLTRQVEVYSQRVHLDIGDGVFIPTKTIDGYEEICNAETFFTYDVHLMVQAPQENIDRWLEIPNVERIFLHAESADAIKSCAYLIRSTMRKTGIVLNPDTSTDTIEEFLNFIDIIQFMTVNPGYYGSSFVEGVVTKIANFHARHPEITLAADGGVNPETAKKLVAAGVSVLVSGSYLYNQPSVGEGIGQILKAVSVPEINGQNLQK